MCIIYVHGDKNKISILIHIPVMVRVQALSNASSDTLSRYIPLLFSTDCVIMSNGRVAPLDVRSAVVQMATKSVHNLKRYVYL